MLDQIGQFLTLVADFLCGYPLFTLLIGGGIFLFIASGAVSLRRLPAAIAELRRKHSGGDGQISSIQALASVVAATVGLGELIACYVFGGILLAALPKIKFFRDLLPADRR